jgi:hypothetical protein
LAIGIQPNECRTSADSPGILGTGYFMEMRALAADGANVAAEMKDVMLRHGLVPAPSG